MAKKKSKKKANGASEASTPDMKQQVLDSNVPKPEINSNVMPKTMSDLKASFLFFELVSVF